ncbi:MAG: hypothetical protein WAK03_13330 [Methylocystis sp.]|jgi:hypothetical protein
MSTTAKIIHVRFAPDGTVSEIGERPASLSAQQWFNTLSAKFAMDFESLSGGRGVYRIAAEDIEALKAAAPQ